MSVDHRLDRVWVHGVSGLWDPVDGGVGRGRVSEDGRREVSIIGGESVLPQFPRRRCPRDIQILKERGGGGRSIYNEQKF